MDLHKLRVQQGNDAHNPEAGGSNPSPATKHSQAPRGLFSYLEALEWLGCHS